MLRQTNHEDFKVFDNCLPFVQLYYYTYWYRGFIIIIIIIIVIIKILNSE